MASNVVPSEVAALVNAAVAGDFAKAQAWYHSGAYQEICKMRHGASDIDAYIVEGFTPPAS